MLVVSKFSSELWFKLNFPELDSKFGSKFSVKVELNFKPSQKSGESERIESNDFKSDKFV